MVIFHSYVNVYQRVSRLNWVWVLLFRICNWELPVGISWMEDSAINQTDRGSSEINNDKHGYTYIYIYVKRNKHREGERERGRLIDRSIDRD